MSDQEFKDFQSPHEASLDRLINAVDRAYHRPGLLLWRSFLQGVMTAIGASVGTFLVFSVVIYVFQALGGIELLRPGLEKLQEMLLPPELRSLTTDHGIGQDILQNGKLQYTQEDLKKLLTSP